MNDELEFSDLETTLSFLVSLHTEPRSEEFYGLLWTRLCDFLHPTLFLIHLDNESDEGYDFSFGNFPLQLIQEINSFHNQKGLIDSNNKTEQHILCVDHPDFDIYAFTDPNIENSPLFIIGRQDSPFNNSQLQFLRLVFNAVIQKTYHLAYSESKQLLAINRDERRTQYNFISAITHDLRNPLGCIKGYVTTLLRNDVSWPTETQHQFLEVINTEADHLQDMISNLLETAKLQSGNYELNYQNINLQLLLEELRDHNKEIHPELTINVELLQETPFVLADQKKLSQAFQNLVDNALKHAKIFNIWFKIKKMDNGFLIQCEDHGEGISEDRLKTIFERFSRSPEFSPGSHGVGLGLYISKEIIERHQGNISVQSKHGEGTTFLVYLPKAPTRKLNV